MFGVSIWEMLIGLVVCVGPLAAIITAVAFAGSSRNRGPHEGEG